MADILMLATRAICLGVAALLPGALSAACSAEDERPLPLARVGSGLDAALGCGDLRDAHANAALEPDARLACAADGLECALGFDDGGAPACAEGEMTVAHCFGMRWEIRCVAPQSAPDAA